MKTKLEKCRKCQDSKAILKEIYFYGRVAYICKDCERETREFRKNISPEYIVPRFLIN